MRVIVLGPKGQLGSDIVRVLQDDGVEVLGLGREMLDAESSNCLEQIHRMPKVDFVVNCLAYVNVDAAEAEASRAFQVNSLFCYHLARHCEATGTKLIHISTDFVFDGKEGRAFREDDELAPVNIYGLSKAAGELAVRGSCRAHYILRVSALYGISGSGSKGGNFVETMIRLAKERGTIRVVSDQMTTPTHTMDVARVVQKIVSTSEPLPFGTYHCANEGVCSWFDFAQEIIRLAGIKSEIIPISFKDFKMSATRPLFSGLTTEKIDRFYKMPAWQKSLSEYFEIKKSKGFAH